MNERYKKYYSTFEKYRKKRKSYYQTLGKAYYYKWKLEYKKKVLEAYGDRCACCAETSPIFLTVDHINNDGASHRRELSGSRKSGTWFYKWLMNNNFPSGFQILCWNCNWAKRFGECPHKNK